MESDPENSSTSAVHSGLRRAALLSRHLRVGRPTVGCRLQEGGDKGRLVGCRQEAIAGAGAARPEAHPLPAPRLLPPLPALCPLPSSLSLLPTIFCLLPARCPLSVRSLHLSAPPPSRSPPPLPAPRLLPHSLPALCPLPTRSPLSVPALWQLVVTVVGGQSTGKRRRLDHAAVPCRVLWRLGLPLPCLPHPSPATLTLPTSITVSPPPLPVIPCGS